MAPSLLAVFAHPDDESLAAGTTRLDVTPWLDTKIDAVLAHRTEVERGALPGLIAGLPPDSRERLLATEWYIRCDTCSSATTESEPSIGL